MITFFAIVPLDCRVFCTIIPKCNMHVPSIAIEYCSQGVKSLSLILLTTMLHCTILLRQNQCDIWIDFVAQMLNSAAAHDTLHAIAVMMVLHTGMSPKAVWCY